ncbi:MAG: hypothetical protein NC413_11325 [Muribaculum sp.]|nr:hypothetical protein [Muribaculum sp.]
MEKVKVYQPFVLSNMEKVFLDEVTNYSTIIDSSDWKEIVRLENGTANEVKHLKDTKNRLLQATLYYAMEEMVTLRFQEKNLLCVKLAVMYNLLKVNFQQQGRYDEEDMALILYMKYRPYQLVPDVGTLRQKVKLGFTLCIHNLLKMIGLYGLSPGRILLVMLFWIVSFAIVYGGLGIEGFDSCQLVSSWGIGDGMLSNMCGAVIYSLLCIMPFPSRFAANGLLISLFSAAESFIGVFLFGYLSFAVVKKTLRN